MMMMIRSCTVALATATVLSVPAVQAAEVDNDGSNVDGNHSEPGNDSGLYIGGSYGRYSSHGGEFEDDEQDLGELSLGYRFNEAFALQAGYIDFGEFGEEGVNAEVKGVSLSAIGRLPVTERFGVYARGGAFAHSTDVDAFDEDETYDDVDPFVGLGADYRFSEAMSLFVEYDRYNVEVDGDDFNNQLDDDSPEFDTAQVGLRYQF